MLAQEHQPIQRLANELSLGQHKLKCPFCQGQRRKNPNDRPLSLKIDADGVQFHCWHCDEKGGWLATNEWDFPLNGSGNGNGNGSRKTADSVDAKTYLLNRGINESLIEKHTLSSTYSFSGSRMKAVGFPYRNGTDTAIKWRSTTGKYFSQQSVCRDFYLLDTYVPGNDILICEGELDALAWLSAGLPENVTVLSVPNGAPRNVRKGKVDPSDDRKFRYVWRAKKQLEQASRIYINTDNDEPGQALQEELSRRIGRAKTWITKIQGSKDAAEALNKSGPDFLRDCFHSSEPMPLIGLHVADDFEDPYISLYEHGQMHGAPTGIASVDRLISIPLGMVSIVTGFPGSGKSDLIDQICVNLAQNNSWKTCYCSFEKPVDLHMAQLAQKLTGKAFFEAQTPTEEIERDLHRVERMTPEERDHALTWIRENFMFMDSSKGGPTDIRGILDVASAAVMRMGCRVLVIDPYNYLTVDRSGMETDAISDMLTMVQQWAKEHDAHVFFIAHPAKPSDRVGKYVCTGLDVAKSMAWFAKADLGLTTWRSPDNETELHVWKARWSWMGKTGMARVRHIVPNSRWIDEKDYEDDYDWSFPGMYD